MTGQVREWLPFDVVTRDAVRQTVEGAIDRWQAHWFVATCAVVSGVAAARNAPCSEGDDGWRIYRTDVAIRVRRDALSRLVDRALDFDGEARNLTEADSQVLTGLGRRIIASLAEMIEMAFGLPGEIKAMPEKRRDALANNGGLLVSLKDTAGRDLLTVAIPTEVTVRGIKANLPSPSRQSEKLRPLTQALVREHIPLEAMVGRVELTLAELNDLAIGDVLVLDRGLNEPVDVASARSRQIFAHARLSHAEDGIVLVF